MKKSVNPIVYKSASVRNLPVPVQSSSSYCSTMDSEEPPYESAEEEAYNRVVGELAKTELECSSRIGILQQEASRLASRLGDSNSGVGDGSPAAGLINKTVEALDPIHRNLSSNSSRSWVDAVKRNVSSLVGHNLTVVPGDSGCPTCPGSTLVRECPPCEECRPCNLDPGTAGGSSSDGCVPHPPLVSDHSEAVEVPMAFLVGALASLLVLAVAVLVGVLLRYLPIVVSGLLFIGVLALVWRLSSKYPEAARRLGARAWGALRSGVSAVVERLFGRNHPEVSANYCLYEEVE